MRGSNWHDGHENFFGDLVHEKCTDGYSHVTTPLGPTLLPQPPQNLKKTNKHVCQVWKHSEVIKHRSLRGLGTSQLLVKWREEKCLRLKRQFGTAATASSETANPFSPVLGFLTRALAAEGDAFSYTSTYVKTVSVMFSCKCSIALEETRVKRS